MFKTKKSRTILVLLALVLTLSVTVFAKQATETISVMYDNIKILIDGVEYTAKDANGNVIEPFIYNGTTYLPVRGIANAFDKNVDWEPQTSTVILGSKNYDWLDQMGYAEYYSSTSEDIMSAIAEKTVMSDNTKYSRGLKFLLKDWCYPSGNGGAIELDNGKYECEQSVSFLLNNNYYDFEGIISCCETNTSSNVSSIIKFYGDGQLIYTSPVISKGMKSTDFNVKVDGIKLLKIKAEIVNPNGKYSDRLITPCIANARLSKK